MLTSKTFTFQNKNLSFLDSTLEKNGTIIFTHANGYSAHCYSYYLELLSEGYRVIGLDFSGHGSSELIYDFKNWNHYRDQILSLIEFLSLKSAIGIGHSMGGACLLKASRSLPNFFQKLILFDPTVLSMKISLYRFFFDLPIAKSAEKRRSRFKSKDQIAKVFRKFPAFSNWKEVFYDSYITSCIRVLDSGEAELVCDPKLEAKNFRSQGFFAPLEFHSIPTETHIIIPEKYEVCSPEMGKKIISKNTKSTLEIVPNITHFFPFENPELIQTVLDRLIP
ncbi:MAG: alpha/beta hydrolase [Leptospiraceae bacterium]|nr:alpha/beta hydrolase [Leptospiraceae bacterium]